MRLVFVPALSFFLVVSGSFDQLSGSGGELGWLGDGAVARPLDVLPVKVQRGVLVLVPQLLHLLQEDLLAHPVDVREAVVDLGVDPEGEHQPEHARHAGHLVQDGVPLLVKCVLQGCVRFPSDPAFLILSTFDGTVSKLQLLVQDNSTDDGECKKKHQHQCLEVPAGSAREVLDEGSDATNVDDPLFESGVEETTNYGGQGEEQDTTVQETTHTCMITTSLLLTC